MLEKYKVLFLDMNKTFMFEADRFTLTQPYFQTYKEKGGTGLQKEEVQGIINQSYAIILEAYEDPARSDDFPQLRDVLTDLKVPEKEWEHLEATFAHYEHGSVSKEYIECLQKLSAKFPLGLICNLWAPKRYWQPYLKETGITDLFDMMIFSSDYHFMKPSTQIFQLAIDHFQIAPEEAVHIGDSYVHDILGAHKVGMDSIWIQHQQELPEGPKPTHIIPDLLSLIPYL